MVQTMQNGFREDDTPLETKRNMNIEKASWAIVVMYVGAQDYLIKGQFDGDSLVNSLHHTIQRERLEYALGKS